MYFSDAYRFNNSDVGFVFDSFIRSTCISYKIYIRVVAVAVVAMVSKALL